MYIVLYPLIEKTHGKDLLEVKLLYVWLWAVLCLFMYTIKLFPRRITIIFDTYCDQFYLADLPEYKQVHSTIVFSSSKQPLGGFCFYANSSVMAPKGSEIPLALLL